MAEEIELFGHSVLEKKDRTRKNLVLDQPLTEGIVEGVPLQYYGPLPAMTCGVRPEYLAPFTHFFLVRLSKEYRLGPDDLNWKKVGRAKKFIVHAENADDALVLTKAHFKCPVLDRVCERTQTRGMSPREYRWVHQSTNRLCSGVTPV